MKYINSLQTQIEQGVKFIANISLVTHPSQIVLRRPIFPPKQRVHRRHDPPSIGFPLRQRHAPLRRKFSSSCAIHPGQARDIPNDLLDIQRIHRHVEPELIAPFRESIEVVVADSTLPQVRSKLAIWHGCVGSVEVREGGRDVVIAE